MAWSREMGALWTHTVLAHDDFDGDGERDWVAFTSAAKSDSTSAGASLEFIEPGTWRTYQRRTIDEPLTQPLFIDLNRDLKTEILALRSPGEIWVFNDHFEVTKRVKIASILVGISSVPDVDGDDVDEIIAWTPGGRILLLDPNLEVRASYVGWLITGVMQRGLGVPPLVGSRW